MSAAEVTAKNGEKLLSEFEKFFAESSSSPKSQYKSFVIKGESNPAQVAKLLELLDKNGITYGKAGTKSGLKGFSYGSGKNESFSTGEEDIIINAYQPKSVLTQLLFEPNPALHDSITYDITSWSMPYAYGLEAYALESRVNAAGEYKKPVFTENVAGKTPVAYIAAWEGTRDAAFLSALLTADIRVKYNEFPFDVEGKSFPAGSLMITKGGNQYVPNFDQKVIDIANKFQVTLATTMSGYVDKGKDFGSPNIRVVKAPKVALVGGEGTNSLNYGAIWHFFEKDLNYPLVNLELNNLARYDLSKYNVLIMPSMRGGGLSEQAQKNIMEWVRAGGKLIVIDGALNLFADKEGFALKTFDSEDDKKAAEKVADSLAKAERLAPYQEGERLAISGGAAGAIYQVKMDETHPLGYGTGGKYYALKNNSSKFSYLSNGVNAGIIASNDAYRTGYIGFKIKSAMGESMAIGVENVGRGEIVYFVDDPVFRGFWESGKLILSNAIFMVGQ